MRLIQFQLQASEDRAQKRITEIEDDLKSRSFGNATLLPDQIFRDRLKAAQVQIKNAQKGLRKQLRKEFSSHQRPYQYSLTSLGDQIKTAVAFCTTEACLDQIQEIVVVRLSLGNEIIQRKKSTFNLRDQFLERTLLQTQEALFQFAKDLPSQDQRERATLFAKAFSGLVSVMKGNLTPKQFLYGIVGKVSDLKRVIKQDQKM